MDQSEAQPTHKQQTNQAEHVADRQSQQVDIGRALTHVPVRKGKYCNKVGQNTDCYDQRR